MNNSFSMQRVGMLLHRQLIQNRQSLSMTAGVIFGIFVIVDFCIYKNLDGPDVMILMAIASISIAAIVATLLGSLTFSSMATKRQRIPAMTLPASKGEKFLSAFILYIIIGNLFTLLAALIPFEAFYLIESTDATTQLWHEFPIPNSIEGLCIALFFIAMPLIGQALYLLGSAFWPRKSFIKTFVTLSVLQIILPAIVTFSSLFNLLHFLESEITIYIAVAAAYLLIALIYYVAWRKFRSWQLVQKFMMD